MKKIRMIFLMGSISAPTMAQEAQEQTWVVNFINVQQQKPATQFCEKMAASIHAVFNAEHPSSNSISASKVAALQIVDQMRRGKVAEYLPISQIRKSSSKGKEKYLPLAALVKTALGIADVKHAVLVLSATDLKFLPYVQQGTQVVLVTDNAEQLDKERTQAVVATANRLNINIHVVWYGESVQDYASLAPANSLAYTSYATGGRFISIGGSTNPCGIKS